MEMRHAAVRIAGVADVTDLLPGRHARAVLHRVRNPLDALAAVVVPGCEVVVEMDVVVDRAALPVQVQHAAGRA